MRRTLFILILLLFACRSFTPFPAVLQPTVTVSIAAEIAGTPEGTAEVDKPLLPTPLPMPPAGLESPYSSVHRMEAVLGGLGQL
jgi:hypothetical protein